MAELRRLGWGNRDKREDNATRQARRNEIIDRLLHNFEVEVKQDYDNFADAFVLAVAVVMCHFPAPSRRSVLSSIDAIAEIIAKQGGNFR